jgi:RNA polymerase sigma-70 factor (ECF subfamily)
VEGRPLEDAELVEQARRGAVEAYTELVGRYQEVAFRAAYLILGDADAAADATQEGFIAMHAALGRFRNGEPVRPWVLTIVGNRARNLRRSAGRRTAATLRLSSNGPPRTTASAEEAVTARERQAAVLQAVNELGPDERAVVACRYFLGLSEAESSRLLGLPPGTIKSRLWRARQRLRERLAAIRGWADA